MTEIEKVAVLLVALGPVHARRVLDRLTPDEMLPIISAMRRIGRVSIEQRNAVLEEVNEILTDLAAGKAPRPPAGPLPPGGRGPEGQVPDLFQRLGPYLPPRVDPSAIDWSAAGFDFGSSESPRPPTPPGQDDDEDPPRYRR